MSHNSYKVFIFSKYFPGREIAQENSNKVKSNYTNIVLTEIKKCLIGTLFLFVCSVDCYRIYYTNFSV